MNGPQVQFFGRLTRDPEIRYSENAGVAYTTVSVAVNTYFGPDKPEETDFFSTTLWRRHAESAVANCRRGSLVFVQGRLTLREFTRSDGTQGHSLQVSANSFRGPLTYGQTPTEQQTAEVDKLPESYDPQSDMEADAGMDTDPADAFDLSENPA